MIEVPQARRLERPRWVNARTVAGLLLFSVSMIAGQWSLGAGEAPARFWAASGDILPGESLESQHLVAIEADLPPDAAQLYALGSTEITGAYVTSRISAGQLIPLDAVTEAPPAGSRQMTVPVEPEHAVGGDLRPGDVVDILVTLEAGRTTARTSVLISGAEVLGIVDAGGAFGAAGQPVGVTIAVSADDAPKLALAVRTGAIDIVRAVGSESSAPGEVTAGDL